MGGQSNGRGCGLAIGLVLVTCVAIGGVVSILRATGVVHDSPTSAPTDGLGFSKTADEGVPIPETAVPGPNNDPSTAGKGAFYYLPSGVTQLALVEWYNKQMPVGTAFQGWDWCKLDTVTTPPLVDRVYTHSGTQNFLAVGVDFNSVPPGGAEIPGQTNRAFVDIGLIDGANNVPIKCDFMVPVGSR